ncbi:Flp family type IVb pilin [Agrobacterium sp. rho-13.3]|jgi:pilus assembly protein Flp/PilA|uniref:Flp family type IVb pilin n=1 Tax=Agrobacterium sp. rho-13.3 TaxID=3072980 RepID=UPI002A17C4C6|nr:Flp family type IVb pilin [Agrobacterium sp. rho-13.3]MDX8308084.1 Flp family type IVb pilin [Agrobacterium sp. rho-13.3]
MAGRAEFVLGKLAALFADRQGATVIEYGLIVAIISTALILGMESIGTNIEAVFELIATTFANAMA